ncbi:MAG: hypothetical protein OIF47_03950 [Marinibacterium sp.]|nr:hypothetical protein [Marinibacterium sp.]
MADRCIRANGRFCNTAIPIQISHRLCFVLFAIRIERALHRPQLLANAILPGQLFHCLHVIVPSVPSIEQQGLHIVVQNSIRNTIGAKTVLLRHPAAAPFGDHLFADLGRRWGGLGRGARHCDDNENGCGKNEFEHFNRLSTMSDWTTFARHHAQSQAGR